MRRVLVIMITVVLTGSLSVGATADSLRVRTDPNDVPGAMDIRTVSSDLSTSELSLGVSTWDRFERRDFPRFVVLLDTTGTRRFDRSIEMLCCGDDRRFICIVYDYPSEDMLGLRAATRPTKKDMACSFPRQWFPDIHRAVRFVVFSDDDDRAPDQGRYHWL